VRWAKIFVDLYLTFMWEYLSHIDGNDIPYTTREWSTQLIQRNTSIHFVVAHLFFHRLTIHSILIHMVWCGNNSMVKLHCIRYIWLLPLKINISIRTVEKSENGQKKTIKCKCPKFHKFSFYILENKVCVSPLCNYFSMCSIKQLKNNGLTCRSWNGKIAFFFIIYK